MTFKIAIILTALLVSSAVNAKPLVFCEEETENCHNLAALELAKQYPQYFAFSDDLLTIKSASNQRQIKLNQPLTYESEDEKFITLDRYFPETNWLVLREIYDGGESQGYTIVDIQHQLKTTELAAPPVMSPDNKFLMTYGVDLEAGFTLNGIVVYAIDQQGDIKEVFRQDDAWGVGAAKWISPTSIELVSKDYCDDGSTDICDKTLRLGLQNNRWQLITP